MFRSYFLSWKWAPLAFGGAIILLSLFYFQVETSSRLGEWMQVLGDVVSGSKDYSLEQLEGILDPRKFFRINRDCVVNIDAIKLMHSYSSSRLQLTLINEEKSDLFVISRDKVASFKKWIDR